MYYLLHSNSNYDIVIMLHMFNRRIFKVKQ